MGMLIDGEWVEGSIVQSKKGSFERPNSVFRTVTHDYFTQAYPGKFRLYVSYACPWAHRCLIVRQLKNLCDFIPVSVVCPDMLEKGWTFSKQFAGSTGDALFDFSYLYELYVQSNKHITTKVTVPILFDTEKNIIVNNESADIITILNSAFNAYTDSDVTIFPADMIEAIDNMNDFIYSRINNGVYKAGFAKTQEAYDIAVHDLFDALDTIDNILSNQRYLLGDTLTASDIYFMPTILRFDLVYYVHFKCNLRHMRSYAHIFAYMQRLYNMPIFKDTTDFFHIKRHYYYSHAFLNPNRIIPVGPDQYI